MTMRDCKYIQVLWVEDQPELYSDFFDTALEIAGIELHQFSCWEDAKVELERNYDKWDAIILDAKCKYSKDDADKADKFLSHVFNSIPTLAKNKDRTIPWYVLSGQGEDDIKNLIPPSNDWDKDWLEIAKHSFYSKTGSVKIGRDEVLESEELLRRIKRHVISRPDMQIEYDLYPDVFKALDRLKLESEVGFPLMRLLVPIHFNGIKDEDYNNLYGKFRMALEEMFRHMINKRILPDHFVTITGVKDSINISWSSYYLAGKRPNNFNELSASDKDFWINITKPLLPKQLAYWLQSAVLQANGALHTSKINVENTMNLDNYLPFVGGSPYMLRSLAMGLCDFILWYDNFLKEHPDAEKNDVDFWTLTGNKF